MDNKLIRKVAKDELIEELKTIIKSTFNLTTTSPELTASRISNEIRYIFLKYIGELIEKYEVVRLKDPASYEDIFDGNPVYLLFVDEFRSAIQEDLK